MAYAPLALIAAVASALAGADLCPGPASFGSATVAPAACTAPAPPAFTGPVLRVLDSRTLCVALGPTPDEWVQVRLADGRDGQSRAALMATAFARKVVCVSDYAEGGSVVAHCALDGVSLSRLTEGAIARAEAASWR